MIELFKNWFKKANNKTSSSDKFTVYQFTYDTLEEADKARKSLDSQLTALEEAHIAKYEQSQVNSRASADSYTFECTSDDKFLYVNENGTHYTIKLSLITQVWIESNAGSQEIFRTHYLNISGDKHDINVQLCRGYDWQLKHNGGTILHTLLPDLEQSSCSVCIDGVNLVIQVPVGREQYVYDRIIDALKNPTVRK